MRAAVYICAERKSIHAGAGKRTRAPLPPLYDGRTDRRLLPPAPDGSDKVDTEEVDEVIEAIAKTVAELTSRQDGEVTSEFASTSSA